MLPETITAPNEHFHLAKALLEDAIESVAKQLDSELVIVGNIGPSHLFANLCGNLEELIIERIRCDLLVVKSRMLVAYR